METLRPALYLIPVTLGETSVEQVLPSYNHDVILGIRHFIVEEIRTARRFLKSVDKAINIDELTFYPMGKRADNSLFSKYLEPLRQGQPIGVISEAGCPCIADPGAYIVALAHAMQLPVIPLVGPSSLLMALMASGFNGQNFAFHGYLPIEDSARANKLKQLEEMAHTKGQTQLFIETPFRNLQMFEELLRTLRGNTRLCVAAGITCPEEYIHTYTINQWKKMTLPPIHKVPAIFLIYK